MVTVEGTITDREGAAIVGSLVSFRAKIDLPGTYPPQHYTQTDANGAFTLQLASGVYEVWIQPPYPGGVPQVSIPKFEVKPSGTRLDYRYSGTRITGEITGLGGSPLASASLSASSYQGGNYVSVYSSGGNYSILVPPGSYDIQVSSNGSQNGLPRLELNLNVGTADTLIDFALTGNEVRVAVTLQGSAPLGGSYVSARSSAMGVYASAQAGLDGTAVLYLPDGGYDFTATPAYRHIVGPVSGYWPISGAFQTAIDFPGIEWNVTLRRTADLSALPFVPIGIAEIGSNRYANATSDGLGRFQLIVRPDAGYDLAMAVQNSGSWAYFTVPNLSSTADSTFDLLVDVPPP